MWLEYRIWFQWGGGGGGNMYIEIAVLNASKKEDWPY